MFRRTPLLERQPPGGRAVTEGRLVAHALPITHRPWTSRLQGGDSVPSKPLSGWTHPSDPGCGPTPTGKHA